MPEEIKEKILEKESNISGDNIIRLIRNLIRYDIPVLMLGKSSIGKSFTIITIADEWNMPNQILYVGSEKSEHIEGLPKLTSLKEGQLTLEYLQPYWFPDEKMITEIVTSGRNLFNEFVSNYYEGKFSYNYNTLSLLLDMLGTQKFPESGTEMFIELTDKNIPLEREKSKFKSYTKKPWPVKREIVDVKTHVGYYKNDLRDICVYICTLLGYGNFWLILDEIDKVEQTDVDKFAPLLHIVRERWLKKWKLKPLNEGKGVDVKKMVKNSDYTPIKDMIDTNISLKLPLLDTRIIAIANKTKGLDEALFRRFCQVIVTQVLTLRELKPTDSEIKDCITKKIGKEVLAKGLRELNAKKIDDVNLQWSLSFFPKMLNQNDILGNVIIQDYREVMKEANEAFDPVKQTAKWQSKKNEIAANTLLFKILWDNYDNNNPELIRDLYDCLSSMIDVTVSTPQDKRSIAEKFVNDIRKDLDIQEQRDEILTVLDSSYPSIIKTGDVSDLRRWVENCTMYIDITMQDKGEFMQTELNKILIPAITALIYNKVTNDKKLNVDNIRAALDEYSKYWAGVVKTTKYTKFKANPEEVQTALYGAPAVELEGKKNADLVKASKGSVFGAGRFATTDGASTEAYKNSLSYEIVMRQDQFLIMNVLGVYSQDYTPNQPNPTFIKQMDIMRGQKDISDYPELIKFIKDNQKDKVLSMTEHFEKNPQLKKRRDEIKNILK